MTTTTILLDGVYLHELLKGSGVYIEPKEEKPKVIEKKRDLRLTHPRI